MKPSKFVLHSPRSITLEPIVTCLTPGFREVLAKTLYSAISPGTELAAWNGLPPLRSGPQYPRVNGYCNVAVIIELGSSCEGYSIGDFILSFSCHCSHFIISTENILCKIDRGMSLPTSSLSYLFHLGYNSILTANAPPGASCAIVGLGALGLTSACFAINNGWSTLGISDQTPLSDLPSCLPLLDTITRANITAHMQYDVVIYTSSSWSDWDLSLKLANQRAKIIVLGFPGRTQPLSSLSSNPLRADQFYQKQLSIIATGLSPESDSPRAFNKFNEKSNLARILSWLSSGILNHRVLSAPIKPASQLPVLYHLLTHHRDSHTYILDWSL